MDPLHILLRWMHIFPALIVVGGLFYIRFALLPASGVLAEQDRTTFRESARALWARWVHASVAFLLVSGFVNFFFKIAELRDAGLKLPMEYHMLWGLKVLLGLILMGFASVFVASSARGQAMRSRGAKWVNVMLVLAVLVVALSGVVRGIKPVPREPAPDETAWHVASQIWQS